MTDLSYANGQLAKNWLRYHGLLASRAREFKCTHTLNPDGCCWRCEQVLARVAELQRGRQLKLAEAVP